MAASITPGVQTSEYKLASRTWWVSLGVMLLGLIVDPLLTAIQNALAGDAAAHPENIFLAVGCVGFGLLSKAIASHGYSGSRAVVKAAALAAAFLFAILLPIGCASWAAEDQIPAYTASVGHILDNSQPGPCPPGVDPQEWATAWAKDRDALKRQGGDMAMAIGGPKAVTSTPAPAK